MLAMRENELVISSEPHNAGVVRKWLGQILIDAEVDEDKISTAILLTTELVTNAILHAGSVIRVVVTTIGGIRVEVHDESNRPVERRQHDNDATVGRGLTLVETLATEYGSVSHPEGGKVVWFSLGTQIGTSDGWSAPVIGNEAVVDVELCNLPAALYLVMREHNEALLREYTLETFSNNSPCRFSADTVAEVELIRSRWIDAYDDGTSGIANLQDTGHLDIVAKFQKNDALKVDQLREVFEDAERLANEGALLTRSVLPELRNLRDWLLEQSVSQLAGGEPMPWRYVDFADDVAHSYQQPTEFAWVREDPSALIAAESDNRIAAVSSVAAAMLGWNVDELIGRRIVAIVPPRLREAHVTGFARNSITGRKSILDQWIPITAWHRNGHEINVEILIKRQTEIESSVAYIAWIRIP